MVEKQKTCTECKDMSDDERIGVKILMEALHIPLYLIANNSGVKGEVVVEEVKKLQGAMGYDAMHDKYVDMLAAGIVDPAKVTRSALENAVSVASMLLTTEAAVVDIPEPKSAPAMPDMGAMGGMGGMM